MIALAVVVDDAQVVAAGKGHVARVEQQGHGRVLHEEVKFGLGLDRGGHVVMVADRHAVRRAPVGKVADLAAIDGDFRLGQLRLGRQGRGLDALHRPRGFAVDDAGRAWPP